MNDPTQPDAGVSPPAAPLPYNPAPAGPLLMLRLMPDLALLAQWAQATGQSALRDDLGYALHAALRATLGELAPKPFALMHRPQSVQLIGYTAQPAPLLTQALAQAAVTDPVAAQALGMGAPGTVVTPMPQDWRMGQVLSFEARVAPVVRSRLAAGAARPGAYPEIDVAYHPDYAGKRLGDRDTAYRHWLQRELGRDGAACLLSHRQVNFALTPSARRSQRQHSATRWAQAEPDANPALTLPASAAPFNVPTAPTLPKLPTLPGERHTKQKMLPDWTARGQLRIDQPEAFGQLLARGLGRHRSFGFGCLLLAPAGAWS